MARSHHYRRRTSKEAHELDMTTFLNLMVVLVPFLLITAVFSRITVVELDLPSSNAGAAAEQPAFRVEVVVRNAGLEITNGQEVIAAIPNVDGEYDLPKLSEYLISLKREYPDKDDASVLLEAKIEYDHLIHVLDAVKTAEIIEGEEKTKYALFTAVSIGDAP